MDEILMKFGFSPSFEGIFNPKISWQLNLIHHPLVLQIPIQEVFRP